MFEPPKICVKKFCLKIFYNSLTFFRNSSFQNSSRKENGSSLIEKRYLKMKNSRLLNTDHLIFKTYIHVITMNSAKAAHF